MKKKCYVRFDDVCPTMNAEEFAKATALTDEYGIKPLLAVIPENLDEDQKICAPDPDFWEKMRALSDRGYTIALHGLNHIYHEEKPKTLLCGRKHSEFAGLPLNSQEKMIRRGKEILEAHGIKTDVFVAPAHTYDKNTLIALKKCGFRYISDGYSAKPYIREGIVCVPCHSFGVPARLRRGVFAAVCHPSEWEKPGKEYGCRQLADFCGENREFIVAFDRLTEEKPGVYVVQRAIEVRNLLFLRLKKAIRGVIKK